MTTRHGYTWPQALDYRSMAAASRKPEKRDETNPYVVELEAQLGRLARLEDPSNTSPTAVVYREMLVAAERSVIALGGRVAGTVESGRL